MYMHSKVLCGNKTDLEKERQVTEADGKAAATSKPGMSFLETSAKTGHNVKEAFHTLIKMIPRESIEYKVGFLY